MTEVKATNVHWHEGNITREERWGALGSKGMTLWFTGLSGSGKSTIAVALEQALVNAGIPAYRLDGDNIRMGLNKNLGFSAEDREENIRRISEVSKLFADAGVVTLSSFISPYKKDRDFCREIHKADGIDFTYPAKTEDAFTRGLMIGSSVTAAAAAVAAYFFFRK